MKYINRKDGRDIETVDEFETRREAQEMVSEYRLADPSAEYYVSNRPTEGWD